MPVGVNFEAYQDMLARKACIDRLTGTQWCAQMDEYLVLIRRIASVEAFMADLIDASVMFVQRVERAQRGVATITANYGMLRQAVESFVTEMERPLLIVDADGVEVNKEKEYGDV